MSYWFNFSFYQISIRIPTTNYLSRFFLSNLRSFNILNFQVCFSLLFLNFLFCPLIHLHTDVPVATGSGLQNYSVTGRTASTLFISNQDRGFGESWEKTFLETVFQIKKNSLCFYHLPSLFVLCLF